MGKTLVPVDGRMPSPPINLNLSIQPVAACRSAERREGRAESAQGVLLIGGSTQ